MKAPGQLLPDPALNPRQNNLLMALPETEYLRLLPNLELVWMPLGKGLHENGECLKYAYFPTSSIVAMICSLENGNLTEVAMVGNEGMLGISIVMSGESMPNRAMVIVAGYGYRLKDETLKNEFDRHEVMMFLLLRYTQALITQMTQTAACNRLHNLDEQLCSWLLLCLDRILDSELDLTQELIANMLGVRREGVNLATRKLQRIGSIEHTRGHIKVLNRTDLEEHSCECYQIIKTEFDRLLPTTPSVHNKNKVL